MNDKVNKKQLAASGIAVLIFVVCAVLLGVFELIIIGISGSIEFLDAGER